MCLVWIHDFPPPGIYSSLIHLEKLVHERNSIEGSFGVTGELLESHCSFFFFFPPQTPESPQIPPQVVLRHVYQHVYRASN